MHILVVIGLLFSFACTTPMEVGGAGGDLGAGGGSGAGTGISPGLGGGRGLSDREPRSALFRERQVEGRGQGEDDDVGDEDGEGLGAEGLHGGDEEGEAEVARGGLEGEDRALLGRLAGHSIADEEVRHAEGEHRRVVTKAELDERTRVLN